MYALILDNAVTRRQFTMCVKLITDLWHWWADSFSTLNWAALTIKYFNVSFYIVHLFFSHSLKSLDNFGLSYDVILENFKGILLSLAMSSKQKCMTDGLTKERVNACTVRSVRKSKRAFTRAHVWHASQ